MSNTNKISRAKLELHQAMTNAEERFEYKSAHDFRKILQLLSEVKNEPGNN